MCSKKALLENVGKVQFCWELLRTRLVFLVCYGRAKCFLQCISSPVVLAICTPELLER